MWSFLYYISDKKQDIPGTGKHCIFSVQDFQTASTNNSHNIEQLHNAYEPSPKKPKVHTENRLEYIDKSTFSDHASYSNKEDRSEHMILDYASKESKDLCHETNNASNKIEDEKPFQVVLDCCDIDISKVGYVDIEDCDFDQKLKENCLHQDWLDSYRHQYLQCLKYSSKPLNFSVEKWCIRIWKNDIKRNVEFPRVVRIWYKTKKRGSSLKWTTDVEGK